MPPRGSITRVPAGGGKFSLYVDHPLGERSEQEEWIQNLENAGKWIKWLWRQSSSFLICAPWWPLAVLIDDVNDQPRVLADTKLDILRHDILCQCGGNVSPHMREHEEIARRRKIPVANLTQFAVFGPYGALPPDEGFVRESRKYHRAIAELSRALDGR